MANGKLVAQTPTGFLRLFLRFPIIMYRYGLGGLLGGRFMLIHHIGRKSGQKREVVVEVIGHDVHSDTYYVASGWGYGSQWYRNIVATPDVDIQVGRRKLNVQAQTLSPNDAAEILQAYRQKHPFTANQLGQVMGLDIAHAPMDELVGMIRDALPIVAFKPCEA